MEKKQLRQDLIKKLVKLSKTPDKLKQEQELYSKLYHDPQIQKANTIGITISQNIEVDTKPIITRLQELHKSVVVPRTLAEHQMSFLPYVGLNNMEKSDFGVWEPKWLPEARIDPPDVVIVPGLAFSKQGHWRVGFGGGYYDRYIAKYQPKTIALALPAQTFDEPYWDVADYDQALDQIYFVSE
ncbi:5-formyltetrahydrofolate cyclo-ligase [Lactobacillus selangorensis]|nr:5-formyltetrahydrofolate cyclo-ligase [Lactobacillus selangorensis]